MAKWVEGSTVYMVVKVGYLDIYNIQVQESGQSINNLGNFDRDQLDSWLLDHPSAPRIR